MGHQIQNLMLTTLLIHWGGPRNVDGSEEFFKSNLDTEEKRRIVVGRVDFLHILKLLGGLDNDVEELVQIYATNAFTKASQIDNPGVIVEKVILSPTEHHRIARTLWYLKLYNAVFHIRTEEIGGLQHVRSRLISRNFFDRLCPWEVDEMLGIYRYMVRNKLRISPSAFDDTTTTTTDGTSFNPFECAWCDSKFLGFHKYNFQREVSPYFSYGSWASETKCAQNPPKTWSDLPASNLPSIGWALLRGAQRQDGFFLSTYNYMVRDLGLIFWDEKRLATWDLLDFPSWMFMKRQLTRRSCLISEAKRFKQAEAPLRGKEQNLIRWTRQSVPCIYEDWLHYERCSIIYELQSGYEQDWLTS